MMYSPSELPDNFLLKAVLILQYSSLHGVMRSLITSLNKCDYLRVHDVL